MFAGKAVLFLQLDIYERTFEQSMQMDMGRKLGWMAQLAAGVQFMHSLNMPHGRLHPQRIYIMDDACYIAGMGNVASSGGSGPLYAPPCGEVGTLGGDMYSLGMIALDVCSTWSSQVQRRKALQDARGAGLASHSASHPTHVIQFMLAAEPARRPSIGNVVAALKATARCFSLHLLSTPSPLAVIPLALLLSTSAPPPTLPPATSKRKKDNKSVTMTTASTVQAQQVQIVDLHSRLRQLHLDNASLHRQHDRIVARDAMSPT
jgi:hypothetical protein